MLAGCCRGQYGRRAGAMVGVSLSPADPAAPVNFVKNIFKGVGSLFGGTEDPAAGGGGTSIVSSVISSTGSAAQNVLGSTSSAAQNLLGSTASTAGSGLKAGSSQVSDLLSSLGSSLNPLSTSGASAEQTTNVQSTEEPPGAGRELTAASSSLSLTPQHRCAQDLCNQA